MAINRQLHVWLAAVALVLASVAPSVHGFDQRELQLFDLVEEVNANFYELLGTSRSASPQDIRRAFRKASMLYHPDRLNKHDTETVDFFRRLNAINEVLKDETLRLRYDEILDNGLPDWRMPVFYYRKWRKLSLFEALLVFAIAFTVGHYLVLWGMYLERKMAFDDLFRRKSRKRQKQLEEELEEEPLAGPTWRDLLPLVTARALWSGVVGAPGACRALRAHLADRRQAELDRRQAAKAEAEALAEEANKREQRKQQKRERREQQLLLAQKQLLADQEELRSALPSAVAAAPLDSAAAAPPPSLIEGPWSEAEQQLLVRAVARFPGGTPGRWEKIAALLHRSVPDVTARAREADAQLRRQAAAAFTAAFEVGDSAAVCGESDEDGDSDDGDSEDGDNAGRGAHRRAAARKNRRRQPQPQQQQRRPVANGPSASAAAAAVDDDEDEGGGSAEGGGAGKHRAWAQSEQSQLEAALRQFPKGTRERWERVATAVGTRSPDECAQRCRIINERLRLKKE